MAIVRAAFRIGGDRLNISGFDSDEFGLEIMEEMERALRNGETGLLERRAPSRDGALWEFRS